MKKGALVILSGFSGVGKGTVAKRLVEKYGYSLSVSATTRQPGKGKWTEETIFSRRKKSSET